MKITIPLLVIIIIFNSCSSDHKTSGSSHLNDSIDSGTKQMIDSLSKIYNQTNFWNHPYASAESAALMEQKIKELQQNNQMNWQVYMQYALECLNAGKTEDAIKILEQAKIEVQQFAVLNEQSKQLYEALAICYLRKGEQDNCILNHSAESCVFPLQGKGIHTNKVGSEKAIELYTQLLEVFPNDLQSRWLLNVAYMTLDKYPDQVPPEYLLKPEDIASDYNLPEFKDIAMNLGLDINELSGGIIADDFNGDGYIDIFVSSWGMKDQIRYFQNSTDGSFVEKTQEAGLTGITGGLNLQQADYNNDGHLDVLVLRGAWHPIASLGIQPNSLLRNNGNGTFSDVTISSGIYSVMPSQTATWLDFDLDGDLDLFIGNETTTSEIHPCEFYLNNGDGTFTNIANEVGLDVVGYIKGVNSGDINQDNYPDIYISDMKGKNSLWVNRGGDSPKNWKFENIAPQAGVENPFGSFATWFFDYNNDGLEDIFVASFDDLAFKNQASEVMAGYLGIPFKGEHPRLYHNNGDETFTDVTKAQNLDKAMHAMGCNYGDFDNDGYIDFYLGTGAPDYRAIVPNRAFRNNEGKGFQEVTTSGRFGMLQKGHGVAFADFDHDGDQDIYSVVGGSVSGDVFRNTFYQNPGNDNQWVSIKLVGSSKSNRSAIGSNIKVTVSMQDGSKKHIYRTVSSGASFGGNSLLEEIGLGKAKSIEDISIKWAHEGSTFISYGAIDLNTHVRIDESIGEIEIMHIHPIQFAENKEHHHHHHHH